MGQKFILNFFFRRTIFEKKTMKLLLLLFVLIATTIAFPQNTHSGNHTGSGHSVGGWSGDDLRGSTGTTGPQRIGGSDQSNSGSTGPQRIGGSGQSMSGTHSGSHSGTGRSVGHWSGDDRRN